MSKVRPVTDFPRNEPGLVDNFLGDAYNIVKDVYMKLEDILYVHSNLPEIAKLVEDFPKLLELQEFFKDNKEALEGIYLNIDMLNDIINNLDNILIVEENLDKISEILNVYKTNNFVAVVNSEEKLKELDTRYFQSARLMRNFNENNGIFDGFDEYLYFNNKWNKIFSSASGNSFVSVPFTYNNGKAKGNETEIELPVGFIAASSIYLNGIRNNPNDMGIFKNNILSLHKPLEKNDNLVIIYNDEEMSYYNMANTMKYGDLSDELGDDPKKALSLKKSTELFKKAVYLNKIENVSIDEVFEDGHYEIGNNVSDLPIKANSLLVIGGSTQILYSDKDVLYRNSFNNWVTLNVDIAQELGNNPNKVVSQKALSKFLKTGYTLLSPNDPDLYELIQDNQNLKFTSGVYNFDRSFSVLDKNIVCESGVIFDFSLNPKVSCFNANGVRGNKINVTKVEYDTLTVEDASSFSVGDDLILESLTRCDNPTEAGEDWCLGAGTSGASPVYFGEPVTIKEIIGNVITLTGNVIFTECYTKKFTGVVATISKVYYGRLRLKGYPTFILSEELHQYALVGRFLKYANIEVDVETSLKPSQAVRLTNCYMSRVKGKCIRPIDWVLEEDHSKYNSWVFLSCWFSDVDVQEENGSQSVDQSYTSLPSISERFKVRSINPKEMGMTTHGMTYKSEYDVTVVGSTTSGFQNRARFSTIKLNAVGNKSASSNGLSLQDWGMTDVIANVSIDNCINGVRFSKSYSAVPHTASRMNININGSITNCSRAYRFESKVPESLSSASSINLRANTINCSVVVSTNGGGWNKRHLSGSHHIKQGQVTAVSMGDPTFGNTVSHADFTGGGDNMSYIALYSSGTGSDYLGTFIDFNTVSFDNQTTKSTEGNRFGYSLNTAQSLITTRKLNNLDRIIILSKTVANSTLTIPRDSNIPVDKEITLIPSEVRITITGEEGVTIIDNRSSTQKSATIVRMPSDVYYII